MPVGELVELEGAERGDQVVADVVAAAGHRGRLQRERLRSQPCVQVGGDGLVRVRVEPAGLAFEEPSQGFIGRILGGEAAPAHRRSAVVRGGDIDGESPGSVGAVGDQVWTAGTYLVTVGVSAAAAAVDAASAGAGTHGDRLHEAGKCLTFSACDHTRPPRTLESP